VGRVGGGGERWRRTGRKRRGWVRAAVLAGGDAGEGEVGGRAGAPVQIWPERKRRNGRGKGRGERAVLAGVGGDAGEGRLVAVGEPGPWLEAAAREEDGRRKTMLERMRRESRRAAGCTESGRIYVLSMKR